MIAVNVREGSYITRGTPVLEIMRFSKRESKKAEVVFFVAQRDVAKLKKGMICNLAIDNEAVPPELSRAVIHFISEHAVSRSSMLKFFPNEDVLKNLLKSDCYEVRASIKTDSVGGSGKTAIDLGKLNWLIAGVTITVDRRSPVAYLFK